MAFSHVEPVEVTSAAESADDKAGALVTHPIFTAAPQDQATSDTPETSGRTRSPHARQHRR